MISDDTITAVARCAREGGVILYPTETVYGLGGDPTRKTVVERIRAMKGRSADKPMLLLTDRWDRVTDWLTHITFVHEQLMASSPSLPVTILFDTDTEELAEVRAGAPRIGIRCTGNDLCRRLIGAAGMPLISTSANISGQTPPGSFAAVDRQIIDAVDGYINAGEPLRGQPSTVVAVEDHQLRMVREGAVSRKELERIL